MLRPSRIHFARALAGVILATVFMFSSPSVAADVATDALINSGIDRYKRHDYEGARAMFSRAYELDPTEVGTLFNLALAELQSGHPVDAARHLRAYLASRQAQPGRLESVRSKWMPEAEAQVGRLRIEAPTGAQVLVDGSTLGEAPFQGLVYIAAGEHDLTSKIGSAQRSMHVTAVAGKVISVSFMAEEAPPAPAPASPPPAPVVAIEKPVAIDGAAPPPQGGTQTAKVVTVVALGSSAVAAAAVALGFGVGTRNAENRANGLRGGLSSTSACSAGQPSIPASCSALQSAVDTQGRDYGLQLGFYTGAGVLAVAAVTSWLVWPHRAAPSAWSIEPAFAARSASAQLVGVF
jgi:hypothetical protein